MADASSAPEGRDGETTEPELPVVFLALPHAGSMCPESMVSLGLASNGRFQVELQAQGSSLLARNFNGLWCDALNASPRPKYFAMHHSDIVAPRGWLDTLVDILEAENADMVSSVVAIKDFNGLTSTALLDLDAESRRRLKVAEVAELPEVFDAKQVAELFGLDKPERAVLLVNTGLWVCRFADQPWIEDAHFHTGDGIRQGEDGRFRAHVFPEDWLWSAEMAARGLKVLATRAIPTVHFGRTPYAMGGERKPWGSSEPDAWVPT